MRTHQASPCKASTRTRQPQEAGPHLLVWLRSRLCHRLPLGMLRNGILSGRRASGNRAQHVFAHLPKHTEVGWEQWCGEKCSQQLRPACVCPPARPHRGEPGAIVG